MVPDTIMAACLEGFLLPSVEGGKPVLFRPDTVLWDEGVLARKGDKELFVMVVAAIGEEERSASMTASFKEARMPAIAVAAISEEAVRFSGERIWIYNPRIHGVAPDPLPVPITASLPVPENDAEEGGAGKPAWLLLGGEGSTWDAAEEEAVRLLPGEGILDLACRVLGEARGEEWCRRPLMLLGGRTPEQVAGEEAETATALSALRKVSLMSWRD